MVYLYKIFHTLWLHSENHHLLLCQRSYGLKELTWLRFGDIGLYTEQGTLWFCKPLRGKMR